MLDVVNLFDCYNESSNIITMLIWLSGPIVSFDSKLTKWDFYSSAMWDWHVFHCLFICPFICLLPNLWICDIDDKLSFCYDSSL